MEKQHILDEIRRTAKAKAGVPLGFRAFFSETGIKTTDWQGIFWARWGDAVREAGLEPNRMREAYDDKDLLGKFGSLIRELGHYPGKWDLRMKARKDETFPSDKTFGRLGTKRQIAGKLVAYCRAEGGLDDVLKLCEMQSAPTREPIQSEPETSIEIGYVYLIKAGRYFKIGKSNAVGRREREIALQLPEKSNTVHSIKTDDPTGIEDYWHRRFSDKRKNGEWFALEAADVTAFKRRKFM